MKEEERKSMNLLLNIINIDKLLQGTIKITNETIQKGDKITDFDVVCIQELLNNINNKVERIKKFDIEYDKVKVLLDKNKSELTEEQKNAIIEMIEKNDKI